MRTVLVTGGAGFIGSHTVVELASAGYRPVIIDNFSNSEHSVLDRINELCGQSITCYEQNFQDRDKLKQVVEKEKPDGIIHFAAYKAVGESVNEPLKYYGNNVSGLISLLEFLINSSEVSHFVFSSSCTVYGEPDELPVTEAAAVKPATSPYGATKQMDETVLKDSVTVSPKLNALALRYFNPVGAHPSGLIGELPKGVPSNLIPFVTQTAAGVRDKLIVYGDDYPTPDGSCIRDYIHVVDLAKAHVKALEYLNTKPSQFFDYFNIGTGKGSSVLEVIKTFEKVSGKKLNYEIGPRRSGDVISTYASVEKANKELGWSANRTLEDALADAWHWQQSLDS
jgi:UDP-glucose 4-epimerase